MTQPGRNLLHFTVVCASTLTLLCTLVLVTGDAGASPALWGVASSADTGTSDNQLNGVSCVGALDCTAVGYFYDGTSEQTLVEAWNGSAWTVVPSPSPGPGDNFLFGVSCINAASCTAVGYDTQTSGTNTTLIESWNGTTWSTVSSPSPSSTDNELYGVSCTRSTNCTAVGYDSGSSGGVQTLVESWNGSAWSVTPSANEGTFASQLLGVSCATTKSCSAVGVYTNGSGLGETLAESWNGTKWSIKTSPNPGTLEDFLYGVSCPSSGSCEAVGRFGDSAGIPQTLVETWKKGAWSVTASPNQGSSLNELRSVSCTKTNDCQAVGFYLNGSSADQTLIESWNGSSWSVTTSPNVGASGDANELDGVSCRDANDCEAAGHYFDGSVLQSLAETGIPPAPKITKFKPASGLPGKTVIITGAQLSGAISVTFNGTAALIVNDTATTIKAKVPIGASSGPIAVTTLGGTAMSATNFTVT